MYDVSVKMGSVERLLCEIGKCIGVYFCMCLGVFRGLGPYLGASVWSLPSQNSSVIDHFCVFLYVVHKMQ